MSYKLSTNPPAAPFASQTGRFTIYQTITASVEGRVRFTIPSLGYMIKVNEKQGRAKKRAKATPASPTASAERELQYLFVIKSRAEDGSYVKLVCRNAATAAIEVVPPSAVASVSAGIVPQDEYVKCVAATRTWTDLPQKPGVRTVPAPASPKKLRVRKAPSPRVVPPPTPTRTPKSKTLTKRKRPLPPTTPAVPRKPALSAAVEPPASSLPIISHAVAPSSLSPVPPRVPRAPVSPAAVPPPVLAAPPPSVVAVAQPPRPAAPPPLVALPAAGSFHFSICDVRLW